MPESTIETGRRISVLGVNQLRHPAVCAMCGNGNRPDGFIDFQIYYDYEGYVYLCMLCFDEALDTLGYLTKDEVNHLKSQASLLATENESLTSQLKDANERLGHYDAIIGSAFANGVNASYLFADSVEPGTTESVDAHGEHADGAISSPEAGQSDSPEPVKVTRRNDSSRTKRGNTTGLQSGGITI